VNTHEPGKTSLTVTKAWDDKSDKDGIRPDSVTIRLFADGADTGQTLVLSAENGWTGSFENLDEMKSGAKISYTVEEESVPGYTASITGDAETGFVVTNSHDPKDDTPKDSVTKSKSKPKPANPAPKSKPSVPKTGDGTLPVILLAGGLAVAAIAALIIALRVKRKKKA
jgi:LPXTG-motif cell wall-anchored protein